MSGAGSDSEDESESGESGNGNGSESDIHDDDGTVREPTIETEPFVSAPSSPKELQGQHVQVLVVAR